MSTERLIHKVQKYPQLYEPKHKLYKYTVKKADIFLFMLVRFFVFFVFSSWTLVDIYIYI